MLDESYDLAYTNIYMEFINTTVRICTLTCSEGTCSVEWRNKTTNWSDVNERDYYRE